MSAALRSLQAACDLRAARSITCQNKCTCFQWFSPLEAALAIYMLALALYNDNGPITAVSSSGCNLEKLSEWIFADNR